MPTRHNLDRISQKHPIVLTRTCGHICAVNTLALEICGVLKNPPAVEGGSIDLDENCIPNSILIENAMELVYRCLLLPGKEKIKEMLLKATEDCLSCVALLQFKPMTLEPLKAILKTYWTPILNWIEKINSRSKSACSSCFPV